MTTDNYNNEINKVPNIITRFLWWCAGADEYFLRKSPKQDRVKYAGIGGIILCTGALAAFSGFFAAYTIMRDKKENHLQLRWLSFFCINCLCTIVSKL